MDSPLSLLNSGSDSSLSLDEDDEISITKMFAHEK